MFVPSQIAQPCGKSVMNSKVIHISLDFNSIVDVFNGENIIITIVVGVVYCHTAMYDAPLMFVKYTFNLIDECASKGEYPSWVDYVMSMSYTSWVKAICTGAGIGCVIYISYPLVTLYLDFVTNILSDFFNSEPHDNAPREKCRVPHILVRHAGLYLGDLGDEERGERRMSPRRSYLDSSLLAVYFRRKAHAEEAARHGVHEEFDAF